MALARGGSRTEFGLIKVYDRKAEKRIAGIMNPMEWLRAIYGALGAKHPTASLLIVVVCGALLFGAVWKLAAYEYQRDINKSQAVPSQPVPAKSGDATTTGNQSPAVTGNGNSITYGQPSDSKKPKSGPPK